MLRIQVFFLLLFSSAFSIAGTDTAFGDAAEKISAWANGSLGTTFAMASLIIGTCVGISKNSMMPVTIGFAGAIFKHFIPTVIEGSFSACI